MSDDNEAIAGLVSGDLALDNSEASAGNVVKVGADRDRCPNGNYLVCGFAEITEAGD